MFLLFVIILSCVYCLYWRPERLRTFVTITVTRNDSSLYSICILKLRHIWTHVYSLIKSYNQLLQFSQTSCHQEKNSKRLTYTENYKGLLNLIKHCAMEEKFNRLLNRNKTSNRQQLVCKGLLFYAVFLVQLLGTLALCKFGSFGIFTGLFPCNNDPEVAFLYNFLVSLDFVVTDVSFIVLSDLSGLISNHKKIR